MNLVPGAGGAPVGAALGAVVTGGTPACAVADAAATGGTPAGAASGAAALVEAAAGAEFAVGAKRVALAGAGGCATLGEKAPWEAAAKGFRTAKGLGARAVPRRVREKVADRPAAMRTAGEAAAEVPTVGVEVAAGGAVVAATRGGIVTPRVAGAAAEAVVWRGVERAGTVVWRAVERLGAVAWRGVERVEAATGDAAAVADEAEGVATVTFCVCGAGFRPPVVGEGHGVDGEFEVEPWTVFLVVGVEAEAGEPLLAICRAYDTTVAPMR